MPTSTGGRIGRFLQLATFLVVTSLILVPALLRACQHFDPRDHIRLSIRLNWHGDAPRAKADIPPDEASAYAVVAAVVVEADPMWASSGRPPTVDDRLSLFPFDHTPRLLRGPPVFVA
jgi:hypothetical protein